jgi:hypothetical protein
MFPSEGNGSGNGAEKDLIGVTAVANAIGVAKSTVSKQAYAGKIPIARFTDDGDPLFDLDKVREARDANLNPNMRREVDEAPDDERRSLDAPGAQHRAASGLTAVMIEERQVRTRGLQLKQAMEEGLLVVASEVERERTTIARGTRDAVEQHVADGAGKAYAFAAKPRTEGEWRIFLTSLVRDAFAERELALAQETDDELEDDELADGGDGGAGAASQFAGSA